jgi:hypothetical protein
MNAAKFKPFMFFPRVIREDENGTQFPGYNWAILFLGDINMGT